MTRDTVLTSVRALSDAFDEGRVTYCHWKSNDRLEDAAAGLTDLDLLIDEAHAEEARKRLAHLGFLPATAVWFRRYPGIEDHLAVDPETGRLVHVHLHLRLVVGSRVTKPYRLPWEEQVLSRRERDPLVGLFRADAASELLLLVVRLVLKGAHLAAAQGATTVDQPSLVEHRYLRARVDAEACAELAATLLGPAAMEPVRRLCQCDPDADALDSLARATASTLRGFRRMSPPREYAATLGRLAGRLLHRASRRASLILPQRRTLRGRGVIVSVLGADGSGKSTLTRRLRTALQTKLDVLGLYLGSGDGPSSLVRAPLDAVRRAASRRRQGQVAAFNKHVGTGAEESAASPVASSPYGNLARLFGLVWSLALALEKRRKVAYAVVARERGFIVVTDRYPQTHVVRFNDGPRLNDLLSSRMGMLRAVARWERSCYEVDERRAPDLVIRLIGDPTVLAARRPEMPLEAILKKQQAILDLPGYPGARSLTIDAGLAEEASLATALKHVWRVLQERQ